MLIIAALKEAKTLKGLFEDGSRWSKGAQHRDEKGKSVDAAEKAYSVCLGRALGLLYYKSYEDIIKEEKLTGVYKDELVDQMGRVTNYLTTHFSYRITNTNRAIPQFNDHQDTTIEDIRKVCYALDL